MENFTQQAEAFIRSKNYAQALNFMTENNPTPASAKDFELRGLAHFHLEDYENSLKSYQAALNLDPENSTLKDMLDKAKENLHAELNIFVPNVQYFDRDKILSEKILYENRLPEKIIRIKPQRNILTKPLILIGNILGFIIGKSLEALIFIWGKFGGYKNKVWTNWYNKNGFSSLATLLFMRDKLNKDSLYNVYPKKTLTGFAKKGLKPPKHAKLFRTANGSWNNLKNPLEGAAGTRLLRNVENAAIKQPSDEELITPSPREISRKLLTRKDGIKEVPFLNLLAASWIQFQNNNWFSHGEPNLDSSINIPLAEDDPAREKYKIDSISINRNQNDPTRHDNDETPITYLNEVGHWWDGSQIYGNNQQDQDRLRSGVDGKLSINEDGRLPTDEKGIEDTGYTRNWWVGLSMFHTLFVKEHNAICDELKKEYPQMEDDQLFNIARLINAAVMAKIHTVEWTPAILPNKTLNSALNSNWYGFLDFKFSSPEKRKTISSINIAQSETGGIVGNPINKHKCAFGLTEEFVEVYRLHSLIPESLTLKKLQSPDIVEKKPTTTTRQAGSAKLTTEYNMQDLFYSFGSQHPGQLVLNNYPAFMQEITIPGKSFYDLGTIDILRAREHGVPRYNTFRRQIGLNPIETFEDLTDNPEEVATLKEIYGDQPKDIEKLDLMIGTLAESHRPTGFGFGETMFQIFILNAARRLQADRFYTTDYNEKTYTKLGLEWIDKATLKKVLLRHYPELAKTGLANIENAFEPWDETENLDPARHPLRAYT